MDFLTRRRIHILGSKATKHKLKTKILPLHQDRPDWPALLERRSHLHLRQRRSQLLWVLQLLPPTMNHLPFLWQLGHNSKLRESVLDAQHCQARFLGSFFLAFFARRIAFITAQKGQKYKLVGTHDFFLFCSSHRNISGIYQVPRTRFVWLVI